MTQLEQAARQALEALEAAKNGSQPKPIEPVIAALRQALEQQPADEPHSWYSALVGEWMTNKTRKEHEALNSYTHGFGGYDLPLYTRPQTIVERAEEAFDAAKQREWVGLTDEDIAEAVQLNVQGPRLLPYSFAHAIEKILKEKNT